MQKVVLTGGSRGLGAAIKERLEQEELATCMMIDGEIPSRFIVTDFSRATGWDLTNEFNVKSLAYDIYNDPPDILILNAGVWKNDWRLNYEAPRELAEQMPKDKLVIFILSNAAYRSYGNDDYTAAKSGLLHYANRKQMEGYHFATIAPGTIDTGFWDGAEIDNRKKGAMNPEVVAELVYQIIEAHERGALVRELLVTPC